MLTTNENILEAGPKVRQRYQTHTSLSYQLEKMNYDIAA
jgi:hypothetical protein